MLFTEINLHILHCGQWRNYKIMSLMQTSRTHPYRHFIEFKFKVKMHIYTFLVFKNNINHFSKLKILNCVFTKITDILKVYLF